MQIAVERHKDQSGRYVRLSRKQRLLILSNASLFAECLSETLAAHLPDYVIDDIRTSEELEAEPLEDVRLVLLYSDSDFDLVATCETLHSRFPTTHICVVVENSEECSPKLRTLVREQKIHGIVPLNIRLDLFVAAIDLITKGGEHFPAALLRSLATGNGISEENIRRSVTRGVAPNSPGDLHLQLTTREVEILDFICQGTQNKNIAADLGLSENTVKVHIRNIYKKMGVRNRTEAAARYFGKGSDHD